MESTQASSKILIVDDEMLIRWSLKEKLSEWGYLAIEAESAAHALALFAEHHPAAVLLDINLPDGSGLDFLQEIKHRYDKTVVIMITAEVNISHTIAALRGGADDFIGKPINFNELQYALDHCLQAKAGSAVSPARLQPHLLIIAATSERAQHLAANFYADAVEITTVSSPEEFSVAIEQEHDLAIVETEAAKMASTLATVRDNPAHAEIPLLVNISHIYSDPTITSVLSQYRAMPCSQAELISLARRRLTTINDRWKDVNSPTPTRLL